MNLNNIQISYIGDCHQTNLKVRAAKLKMKKIKSPIVVKRNLTIQSVKVTISPNPLGDPSLAAHVRLSS